MSGCLTRAEFERFDEGDLEAAEALRLEHHILECAACAQALREIQQNQKFLDRVRPHFVKGLEISHSKQSSSAEEDSGILGTQFPKIEGYNITGVLGQGGMGIVYRAVQVKLNRDVALKVLPAMVGSASPSAVSRFRREATSAARLHHTHIVPIYDFGESRDAYYYAMELIEGQPFSNLISLFRDRNITSASPARFVEVIHECMTSTVAVGAKDETPVPPGSRSETPGSPSISHGRVYFQQVARWIADAADALHYAHGEGIIHRDIKPANVILSRENRIMIADFGLARSSEEESETLTGALLGTVRYMSPEQAMAKRIPIDHRTDIYSLGATMYELLALRAAFPGSDDKQVLAAIITQEPAPPRKILASIPRELETICLKCLEKSPSARYSTGRALAEDLRRYSQDLPIFAKRPGPIRRAQKFVRRHRAAVIAVTAALLFLGTSAVLYHERVRRIDEENQRRVAEHNSRVEQINNFLEQGRILIGAGNWSEAGKQYEAALALDPENVRGLANLAIVKKELYDASPTKDPRLLDEALKLVERATTIDPSRTRAWNTKGVVFKMLGHFDQAAEAYEHAIRLDPRDPYVRVNLAAMRALGMNLSAAEESLRAAISLLEASGGTVEATGKAFHDPWRDLASILLLRGESDAAAQIDNAMARGGKDDPWVWVVRARLRMTLPGRVDLDGALDDAKIADAFADARVAPGKFPLGKRILAWALLRNGHLAEALTNARQALALDDLPAPNYLIMAIAHAKNGQVDLARTAFQEALKTWPEKLSERSAYYATAPGGNLWFESAQELDSLRDEAAAMVSEQ